MIKALLCDLDETLVDTVEHAIENHRLTLAAWGHTFTREQLRAALRYGSLHRLREHLGISDRTFYGPEGVFAHRQLIEIAIENGDIRPIPGARELLADAAGKGYRIAIITNSDLFETRAKMRLLGFEVDDIEGGKSHVGALVAIPQNGRHKPDPSPALHALECLRLHSPAAARIVFIGDLATDVECGANLRALGYHVTTILLNHYDDDYAAAIGADHTVRSLDEARQYL